MAKWIGLQTTHSFYAPGETEATQVRVSGLIDESETERSKVTLYDITEVPQRSFVSDEQALVSCINDIAQGMREDDPKALDWYVVDSHQKLHSVELTTERVRRENPEFTRIKNDDDSLFHNDKAREVSHKAYPDIVESKLRAALMDVSPQQCQQLNTAYQAAINRGHGIDR